tara:strand:- start:3536 stop:4258 length:723 start_codon:yes stop_codon:yes gene_type:complete
MGGSVRILASIALLSGGLFVMKALDFGFGVSDAWATYASDPAPSNSSDDDAGDHEAAQTEEPFLPDLTDGDAGQCPTVEVSANSDAFAARVGASPSEIEVLRSLSERRRSLDSREAEIDTRESLLQAAEVRVDERIAELRALRDDIESMIGALTEAEEAEMGNIAALYRGMDPKDAAPRLAALDGAIQVQIASRIPSRNFSAILAEMEIEDAARLTLLLAARNTLPATAAELETRLGREG